LSASPTPSVDEICRQISLEAEHTKTGASAIASVAICDGTTVAAASNTTADESNTAPGAAASIEQAAGDAVPGKSEVTELPVTDQGASSANSAQMGPSEAPTKQLSSKTSTRVAAPVGIRRRNPQRPAIVQAEPKTPRRKILAEASMRKRLSSIVPDSMSAAARAAHVRAKSLRLQAAQRPR
jgi:hypothetical protein